MFDLHRNLLTTLLAAGIGLAVLTGLVVAVFMGRPDVDAIAPLGSTQPAPVEVDVPDTGLQEFENYSAILERPVFFSDRQLPVVEVADVDATEESPEVDEPAEEITDLEAVVAGIIITPEMKLAMVSDEQAGKTLVMREGMSLEGEQAAWKIDTIEPRQVGFVSVDGRQTLLELKVNTAGLTGSNVSRRRETTQTEGAAGEEAQAEPEQPSDQISEEARARAEEIRRRVAERRAQLRAEAERRAQQNEQQRDNDG
ncbi:hypothetical protein G4Y73_10510 [Wenzhouxiangella sp. XN201]|uniref:hypothetical protein n=1 Tax=Wenzhouxiangella sp. XN201 TaxID=2710755 RepID=UPI0013C6A7B1|nr:hypothetical protein [Wenzhouxiangella sp. XN201]NEZ04581.1 hypothetical protein [Wenzhouxiangella sp. XN201]